MSQYYYVTSSNQQAGPYDLNALVAQGITPQTLVWKEGLSGWVPAAQVPEVAAALARMNKPQGGYTPPPPYVAGLNGEGVPQRDYLVWSILICALCFGGLSFGVAALVMSIVTRIMNRKGQYQQARLFSKLALIFNIAGTALGAPFALLMYVAMLAG